MLETTLRTILDERNGTDDSSGNLGRLIRKVEEKVGLTPGDNPAEHQIITGVASIINGICTLSNEAGDRHGTIGGRTIDDPVLAELCVYLCGTIAIFFIELHLMTEIRTS